MSNEILGSSEKNIDRKISLMVSGRFLDQVVEEIVKNPNPSDETGGIILGARETRKNGRIFIAPLGSVNADDPDELERRSAHLNIGGPLTNISRVWQVENWESIFPELSQNYGFEPGNPETKLTIIGHWHKHPGSFIHYSGEDSGTVDNILKASGKDDYLFPIAILRSASEGGLEPVPNATKIRVGKDLFVDIEFHYRSAHDGKTQTLTPEIYYPGYFPSLAPSPWYIESPRWFKGELAAFQKLGLKVSITYSTRPGLRYPETWLKVSQGNNVPYYVRMSYRFPKDRLVYITRNSPDDEDCLGQVFTVNDTIANTVRSVISDVKEP